MPVSTAVMAARHAFSFPTMVTAAGVGINTLFRDLADGHLKFKDKDGVVRSLY